MAELTPRARRFLLALGGLYALVNAFIGVHSGGDFVFHLRLAERLLQGQPLYADFDGSTGLPWPPFAIVTLVPFALLARLSLPLTKAVWAIGNVALFGWCLVRGHRHAGRWTPVVLAVAAVAQPLQSNFQHLNINLLLLALVVLAIADLEQGHEMRAALWIGVAAVLWRGRAASEPTYQVGMTAVLAVLLAPLDRLHYYVLAFPAWTDTFGRPAPPRGRAVWFTALAVGALLTSGMLSHFGGPLPTVLWTVRQNTYNFGALILLIVLVARRVALPQPLPVSQPT